MSMGTDPSAGGRLGCADLEQLPFARGRILGHLDQGVAGNGGKRLNAIRQSANQLKGFEPVDREASEDALRAWFGHIFPPVGAMFGNEMSGMRAELGEANEAQAIFAQPMSEELGQEQCQMS